MANRWWQNLALKPTIFAFLSLVAFYDLFPFFLRHTRKAEIARIATTGRSKKAVERDLTEAGFSDIAHVAFPGERHLYRPMWRDSRILAGVEFLLRLTNNKEQADALIRARREAALLQFNNADLLVRCTFAHFEPLVY